MKQQLIEAFHALFIFAAVVLLWGAV